MLQFFGYEYLLVGRDYERLQMATPIFDGAQTRSHHSFFRTGLSLARELFLFLSGHAFNDALPD